MKHLKNIEYYAVLQDLIQDLFIDKFSLFTVHICLFAYIELLKVPFLMEALISLTLYAANYIAQLNLITLALTWNFIFIYLGQIVCPFLSLKVLSAVVLVVCFVSLKEGTYETRENAFYITSKAFFILEIIKF